VTGKCEHTIYGPQHIQGKCWHKATGAKDGVPHCGVHDPDRPDKRVRIEKRDAAFRARQDVFEAKYKREAALLKLARFANCFLEDQSFGYLTTSQREDGLRVGVIVRDATARFCHVIAPDVAAVLAEMEKP
jgi:hypothetical protein